MKSSEYWRRRFEALEDAQTRKGAEYFSQLEKQYQKASAAVQKEVNAWYARFAVNNEISLVEAKKLLNARELKELQWNVMEYIEKGKTLNISDAWAKELENASARWHISRLEALQLQMQNQVEVLYGTEYDEFSKLMEDIYTEGYYHTAYEIQSGFNIGYDLMKLDTNRIKKVLSKPWAADGANFSSRIWKQKAQLVNDLHTELTQAIVRGKNPHQVTQAIAKRFDVSMGQAGRLVSTEAAFFASASNRDCYKDLGVEQYEILATLDHRTSDVCQGLDGKVFKMSEYEVGVTAPPFHVWCRTTTVPFFDDEFELGAERAARGADGRTYYVPADMKYPEWKKTFVDGGSKKDLLPLNDDAVKSVIKSIEDEDRGLNYECGAVIGKDGTVLKRFKGTEHAVEVSDDDLKMMEGAIFTHNHPLGVFFSDNDIETGFVKTKLGELRASTPQGITYVLKSNGNTTESANAFIRGYKQTRMRANRTGQTEIINRVKLGEITLDDYKKNYYQYYRQYEDDMLVKYAEKHAEEFGFIFEVEK